MSSECWPYDPMWKTSPGGRFFYTDYDGESLIIYRRGRGDREPSLWVETKGEGPVLIKPEHLEMIIQVLRGERVPDSGDGEVDGNAALTAEDVTGASEE